MRTKIFLPAEPCPQHEWTSHDSFARGRKENWKERRVVGSKSNRLEGRAISLSLAGSLPNGQEVETKPRRRKNSSVRGICRSNGGKADDDDEEGEGEGEEKEKEEEKEEQEGLVVVVNFGLR